MCTYRKPWRPLITRMRRDFFVALVLGLSQPFVSVSAADHVFAWPNGARAAVSLAYDDALDSQLDHAIPALDRYGLKATFYLTLSNESVLRRIDEWRQAARSGHELGNHSLFHQCSKMAPAREWVTEQRNLDTTSAGQMRDQVLLANTFLHAIDGKRERTFTPPCGDVIASGENYVQSLRSAFVAFRTEGATPMMNSCCILPRIGASIGPTPSSRS